MSMPSSRQSLKLPIVISGAIATASLLAIAIFHPANGLPSATAIAQTSPPTTAIPETTIDLGSHSQFEIGTSAGRSYLPLRLVVAMVLHSQHHPRKDNQAIDS